MTVVSPSPETPSTMSTGSSFGSRRVEVVRADGGRREDRVAVEAALEIRVDGTPLAVTMRTPGDDEDLAAGFLYSEGVVDGPDDIDAIVPHRRVVDEGLVALGASSSELAPNAVEVSLATAPDAERLDSARRDFRATAACGVCGKETLEDLFQNLPPLVPMDIDEELLRRLPGEMRPRQSLFHETGGLHAAALFDGEGRLLCIREDIGRHNAVDKVIGHFLRRGESPLAGRILVLSGRAGFELVQKALRSAIPIVASVGAASSLAVDMASRAGLRLYSFVGPGRGNRHL